jgi:hypothetical protein
VNVPLFALRDVLKYDIKVIKIFKLILALPNLNEERLFFAENQFCRNFLSISSQISNILNGARKDIKDVK